MLSHMSDFIESQLRKRWYIYGILCILLFELPYIVNGADAFYRIHDFLEQDIVHISLESKVPFSQDVLPQLFDGTYMASIQTHSLLQIILYMIFPGWSFLVANQFVTSVLGFCGLYLVADSIYAGRHLLVKFMASLCFAILPLLSHGATVLGFPLCVYLMLRVRHDSLRTGVFITAMFLYGIGTSLVAGGFGYVFLLGVVLLCAAMSALHFERRQIPLMIAGLAAILSGYIISFRHSILMLGSGIETHRISWELAVNGSFVKSFLTMSNGEYPDFHKYMILVFILTSVSILFYFRRRIDIRSIYAIIGVFVTILIISCLSALYTSTDTVMYVRKMVGTLGRIQFDRITFFLPGLWYILFAFSMSWLLEHAADMSKASRNVCIAIIAVSLCVLPASILRHSPGYGYNIKEMLGIATKSDMTYGNFLDDDLWGKVRESIGRPQRDYRVSSLGINAGIPLFEGFYCLDGYSTNYPNRYKEAWRTVILPELEQNEMHMRYYDSWGSRVYLISHDLDFRCEFEPYGKSLSLNINMDAFRELGGEYIFSAVDIINADELGLVCTDKVFSKDGKRCVYIYRTRQ